MSRDFCRFTDGEPTVLNRLVLYGRTLISLVGLQACFSSHLTLLHHVGSSSSRSGCHIFQFIQSQHLSAKCLPFYLHLWELIFSWVAQSCPTLYDPMDCSVPGFPVHQQLPQLAQTHVHQVSDAIQPSHPLLSPSPPAVNICVQNVSLVSVISESWYHLSIYPGGISEAPPMCQAQFQTWGREVSKTEKIPTLGNWHSRRQAFHIQVHEGNSSAGNAIQKEQVGWKGEAVGWGCCFG